MDLTYDKTKLSGIQQTSDKAERIIVDNILSVEVMENYSYTLDPEILWESSTGKALLDIQRTDASDFLNPNNAGVRLTLQFVAKHNTYSTLSEDIKKCAQAFVDTVPGGGELRKAGDGIWMAVGKDPVERMGALGYFAFICTAGSNNIYNFIMTVNPAVVSLNSAEQRQIRDRFLNSISAVTAPERIHNEKLSVLNESFICDFSEGNYANVDGRKFRFPLPAGYKKDNFECFDFVVVPENYKQTDMVFNPKIGFVSYGGVNTDEYDPETCNEILIDVAEAVNMQMPNFIDERLSDFTVRKTNKGIITYQFGVNEDSSRLNYSVLVYAGNKVHICTFVVSFNRPVLSNARSWDAHQIAAAWLGRILFEGEKAPEVRSATNKQSDAKQAQDSTAKEPPLKVISTENLFEHVQIALAPGYKLDRDKDDDGKETLNIVPNKRKKKNADDNPDVKVSVSVNPYDPADYPKKPKTVRTNGKSKIMIVEPPNKASENSPAGIIKRVAEGNDFDAWLAVLDELPFCLQMKVLELPPMIIVPYAQSLYVKAWLPGNQILKLLGIVYSFGEPPEGEIVNNLYNTVFDVIRMIRIDGKALTLPESYSAMQNRLENGEKNILVETAQETSDVKSAKQDEKTVPEKMTKKASAEKAPVTDTEKTEKPAKEEAPIKSDTPKQTVKKSTTAPKVKEFQIVKNVLRKYNGNAERVVIPDGVTAIGKDAFERNESVRSIVVPESVREIYAWAFSKCTNLEEVKLHDKVEYISKDVFYECKSLCSFILPGNVTSLELSLYDCDSLKWFVIHKNIDTVADSFRLPKGVTVYGELPPNAKNLRDDLKRSECVIKENELPKGVSKPVCTLTPEQRYMQHFHIENGSLKKVRFDEYVHNEWDCTYYNGTLLLNGEFGSVALPQGITKVDASAFSTGFKSVQCFKEIVLPNSMKEFGGFFKYIAGLEGIEIPYGVTDFLSKDPWWIVENCKGLRYITLPDTVKRIGIRTIRDCQDLTSINIPGSVESIHKDFLSGCPNVTIYGERGTKAEEFARSKGIPFCVGLPQGVPKPRVENDIRPIQRETQIRNAEIAKIREKDAKIERARIEKERQIKLEEERRRAAAERQRLEAERRVQEERRRAEEQKWREAEIARLNQERQQQLMVIEQNQGGIFGEKAKRRRAAKERLEEIEEQIYQLMNTK